MKLKWVFAALVLANLGLWMWASWYKEAPLEETRAARAPVAPEKMRLLTEAGVKPVPRKKPPPANAELTANGPAACVRIGPFRDSDLLAIAEAKLDEMKLAHARRSEELKIIAGYRIYLPPLASKEAAERRRKELTRLGIKDHVLMQEEGWRNAIALGLFSVEANAMNRVRELAAKGVTASIQPLEQPRTQRWLDIGVPVPPETTAQLKESDWGAREIQIQELPCPAGDNAPPDKPDVPPDNAPT